MYITAHLVMHLNPTQYFCLLQFTFEARNNKFALDTKLGVQINILDINDNAPAFNSSLYETTLDESASQGDLTLYTMCSYNSFTMFTLLCCTN